MCTVFVAHEIVHAMWKALSQAEPERSCAGWGKPIHGVTSSSAGRTEPFVLYHWNALAGAGAVDGRDGFHQIGPRGAFVPKNLGGNLRHMLIYLSANH